MDYDTLRTILEEAPLKGYPIINRTARGILFNRKSMVLVIIISLMIIPALYWSLNLAGTSITHRSYVGGQLESNVVKAYVGVPRVLSYEENYTFYGEVINQGDREVEFEMSMTLGDNRNETGSMTAAPGIAVEVNFSFTAGELSYLRIQGTAFVSIDMELVGETAVSDLEIFRGLENIDLSDIRSYDDIVEKYRESQGQNPYDIDDLLHSADRRWTGEISFDSYHHMLDSAGVSREMSYTTDIYGTEDGLLVNLSSPDIFNVSRDETLEVRLTDLAGLHSAGPSYELELLVEGASVAHETVSLHNETGNYTIVIPAHSVERGFDRAVSLKVHPADNVLTFWPLDFTADFLGEDYYREDLVNYVDMGTSRRFVARLIVEWTNLTYLPLAGDDPGLTLNYLNYDLEPGEVTPNEVTFSVKTGSGEIIEEHSPPAAYYVAGYPSPRWSSYTITLEPGMYREGEIVRVAVKAKLGPASGEGMYSEIPPIEIDVLNHTGFHSGYWPALMSMYGMNNATMQDVFVPLSVASVEVPEELSTKKDYEFEGEIRNSGDVDKNYILVIIIQNETAMTLPLQVKSMDRVSFDVRFDTGKLEKGFEENVSLLLMSYDGELIPSGDIDEMLQDPDNAITVEGYAVYETDIFERGLVEQQAVSNFLQVFSRFVVGMSMLVCLIFGTSVFGQELESRTMNLMVTLPISKLELVIYKYIGYLMALPALLFIPTILIYTSFSLADPGLFVDNLGLLGIALFLVFLVVASLGAVFIMLGTLSNHPIFWGLTYMLAWENFVAIQNWNLALQKYTLIHHVRSIIYPLMKDYSGDAAKMLWLESGTGKLLATPQTLSLIIIPVVIIVVLGMNVLILKGKDYT